MTTLLADPITDVLLPVPVSRWLATAWPDGVPDHDTLVLVGQARLRRNGGGPRLPARFRMTHVLGRHHVADIRVGIGPVTLVHAFDAYVDGHGFTQVGTTIDDGPAYDQAAFLFLWCEAFLYPTAWRHLPGMCWETINHHVAQLCLPFEGGVERAFVHFDPETGFPCTFEASRHKGDGPRVPWHVDFDDWGWSNGLPVPRRGAVQWDDEPEPWFTFTIEEAIPDVPVEDELHRARAVLALAMGTAPG